MRAGANLDGFVLVRVLGEGSFGSSWVARESRRGTQAVVKLLAVPSRSELARLITALKQTASISHPVLQPVLRSVQAPEMSALGLACEYIEGQTLAEVLIEPRKLLFYLRWFEQLAEALAFVHSAGVAHGGIKPSNVVITKNGEAKLLDLAWSQLADPAPAADRDVFALKTLFDRLVMMQLPSVPPALLRLRASSADDLARTLAIARRELEEEPTNKALALARPRGDSFDAMEIDVEPQVLERPVSDSFASELSTTDAHQVLPRASELPTPPLTQAFSADAPTPRRAIEPPVSDQFASEPSTTVPVKPKKKRSGISPLAAWGIVLLATSALVASSSALWFHREGRAKALRSMALVEPASTADQRARQTSPSPPPLQLRPVQEPEPVRVVEPVMIPAKKEIKPKLSETAALDVSCDEGDGDACMKLGELRRADVSLDHALLAYERACKFGNGNGCRSACELGSKAVFCRARTSTSPR